MLLGDDGTPRKISRTTRGRERLWSLKAHAIEPLVVTDNHILCLRETAAPGQVEIRYVEMTVAEFTALSDAEREKWRMYQVPLEPRFTEDDQLEVDAYFLGLWNGDGDRRRTSIFNNQEEEIVDFLREYAAQLDLELVFDGNLRDSLVISRTSDSGSTQATDNPRGWQEGRDAVEEEDGVGVETAEGDVEAVMTGRAELSEAQIDNLIDKLPMKEHGVGKQRVNVLLSAMRRLGVVSDSEARGPESDRKHIPDAYKFGSRSTRLKVLAGLIDSDGCYDRRFNRFVFTQSERSHTRLFDDFVFVARSLGLKVWTSRQEAKTTTYQGKPIHGGAQLRAYVMGAIYDIPTLLRSKMAADRVTGGDRLGHEVLSIEQREAEEDFFGFEVDGNKRFLRKDFLVVHNSGFEESMKFKKLTNAQVSFVGGVFVWLPGAATPAPRPRHPHPFLLAQPLTHFLPSNCSVLD